MDKSRRKELQNQYKEIKTFMGVSKITNTVNGKIFVAAFPNMKNRWMTLRSQLNMGNYPFSAQLQKDWKEYGEQAFTYEVLEEKDTEKILDIKWELKQLEKAWLEKLQPYGDRGYNSPPKNITA